MEGDIEACFEESSNQCEEMNFDLITRYYQVLLGQAESQAGGGKMIKWLMATVINATRNKFTESSQNPEICQMLWSQFLLTLSAILQAQTANVEQNQSTSSGQ